MDRSIVILKTIITIWEMTGHKQLSRFESILLHLLFHQLYLVKLPTSLYEMQTQIMTLIFLITPEQIVRLECFIAFSANIDSIVISNHNLALVQDNHLFPIIK